MRKKIFFQKCNFNSFYFLFYIIAYIIEQILFMFFGEEENSKIEDIKHFNFSLQFVIIISSNISDFLAIIPYLIRKHLLKNSNINSEKIEEIMTDDQDNENKDKFELIYNDNKISETQKRKKYVIIFCLLLGIFDFLKDLSEIINYIISDKQEFGFYPFSFTVIFDIFLQFVFSFFLLNVHFYKLQFFSLFLNFGIFVIILIIDLCNYFLKNSCEPQLFILFPCYLVFYCLEYIYCKKAILYGYISVYLLMIIKGVIKLILLILLTIILFLVKKDFFDAIPFLFSYTKNIILLLLYIICDFFMNLSLFIIIDRFSPNHTSFILLLEELINFIISIIKAEKPTLKEEYKIMGWDLYIRIFLYLISFFGVLLHNEIIVINYCGLGSDTKYFLDIKFEKEEEYINADNPEELRKFETMTEMENQSNDNKSN